jgi:hypothetical protein
LRFSFAMVEASGSVGARFVAECFVQYGGQQSGKFGRRFGLGQPGQLNLYLKAVEPVLCVE